MKTVRSFETSAHNTPIIP
jgi:hypothetical protein